MVLYLLVNHLPRKLQSRCYSQRRGNRVRVTFRFTGLRFIRASLDRVEVSKVHSGVFRDLRSQSGIFWKFVRFGSVLGGVCRETRKLRLLLPRREPWNDNNRILRERWLDIREVVKPEASLCIASARYSLRRLVCSLSCSLNVAALRIVYTVSSKFRSLVF